MKYWSSYRLSQKLELELELELLAAKASVYYIRSAYILYIICTYVERSKTRNRPSGTGSSSSTGGCDATNERNSKDARLSLSIIFSVHKSVFWGNNVF